jgi:hypothetical protein
MRAIGSRIRRLQRQLCPNHGQKPRFWSTTLPGQKLALDLDACEAILGECGFLPAVRFGVLNFMDIPDGLNPKELEKYLRKNGAQICGTGENLEHIELGAALRPGHPSLSAQAQIGAD